MDLIKDDSLPNLLIFSPFPFPLPFSLHLPPAAIISPAAAPAAAGVLLCLICGIHDIRMSKIVQGLMQNLPSGRLAAGALGLFTVVGGGSALAYNGLYNGVLAASIPSLFWGLSNLSFLWSSWISFSFSSLLLLSSFLR